MRKGLGSILSGVLLLPVATRATPARAQVMLPPRGVLDPARTAVLRLPPANRLREEFIWTTGDAAARDPRLQASVRGQNDKIAPHFFRAHFHVGAVPSAATLYLAGPRSVTVYLNGQEVLRATDDGSRPKNLSVLSASVEGALRRGDNVLALEEVRGHSSLHTGASPTINQVTYGEVLAVKIVPRTAAVDAAPLMVSGTSWRSTLDPAPGWQKMDADGSDWRPVESLGVLGSKRDFLQWNADAGLYAWPGYSGISQDLRVFPLRAAALQRTLHPEAFRHTEAVTSVRSGADFTVTAPPTGEAASITLDFGREISARLRLVSASNASVKVLASYGESPEEANKDKGYLGMRPITVPAHGTAFGPKSAFRYVKLNFPAGTPVTRFHTVDAQVITYPVRYLGSFESSDPEVNRIWETAAYTARLCMQEGIWDGTKRDRGRWMGDLDVTSRTITGVFGESRLMERTMAEVIGEAPVTRDVNTIAGYSALWITGQAAFYRQVGDLAYLRRLKPQLVGLLGVMDAELGPDGLFTNPQKHKVFVDWSDGLSADTPEARAATHLEFLLAYREAAFLFTELHDEQDASRSKEQAERLAAAAQKHLVDPATQTFGGRWQTNAMAVVSGAASEAEQGAIWNKVLSHVGEPGPVITPYYGYYALLAMAHLGHTTDALRWMREYWGGMLREGASSFWEAYDPRWPKADFHASLEADGKKGYYVSLAHGWASGPARWLQGAVLGIEPTAAGFREVTLRPDLGGLRWARGAQPTPRGLLRVELTPHSLRVTLPPGTRATVLLPFDVSKASTIRMNHHALPVQTAPAGARLQVVLDRAGTYLFASPSSPREPSLQANHRSLPAPGCQRHDTSAFLTPGAPLVETP